MSKEKVYPKGLRVFAPREGAPDFVKGTLVITPNDLVTFCKENESYMNDYNGSKQLKCQMLEGDKGIYLVVDTWKPDRVPVSDAQDNNDLPF